MMKSVLSFVCVSLAFALGACNSSSDSGLGTGSACTANSECASNICVKWSRIRMRTCGTGCMPACASTEACVASTSGHAASRQLNPHPCRWTVRGSDDSMMQGGQGGSETTTPSDMSGGEDTASDAPCGPALDCLENCHKATRRV